MNQQIKPFAAFAFLAGALAVTAPAQAAQPTNQQTATQESRQTLLAYAPDAAREAYRAKVKALKARQKAAWNELQREHKLAISNPMLSHDDVTVLRKQQAEENQAAKETYAGQLQVLAEQFKDEDSSLA